MHDGHTPLGRRPNAAHKPTFKTRTLLFRRQIAMLDHLTVAIRLRHGTTVDRTRIIQAILTAAMMSGISADDYAGTSALVSGSVGSTDRHMNDDRATRGGRPRTAQKGAIKTQVVLLRRHVALLDHLMVTMRLRPGTTVDRSEIIRAVVTAAMRRGVSADDFV